MRALAIVHQTDAGPGRLRRRDGASAGWSCDEWLLSERGTGPPLEIADYDAVLTFGGAMHADQEDRHPWLRFEKDFLAAMIDDRHADARGLPRLPAAGRGGRRLGAARERAGDRLARGRGDRGGRARIR